MYVVELFEESSLTKNNSEVAPHHKQRTSKQPIPIRQVQNRHCPRNNHWISILCVTGYGEVTEFHQISYVYLQLHLCVCVCVCVCERIHMSTDHILQERAGFGRKARHSHQACVYVYIYIYSIYIYTVYTVYI